MGLCSVIVDGIDIERQVEVLLVLRRVSLVFVCSYLPLGVES